MSSVEFGRIFPSLPPFADAKDTVRAALLEVGRQRGIPRHPRFAPFLGTDLSLGSSLNPNITGNRAYTRAHFLDYAGVVTSGVYRWVALNAPVPPRS